MPDGCQNCVRQDWSDTNLNWEVVLTWSQNSQQTSCWEKTHPICMTELYYRSELRCDSRVQQNGVVVLYFSEMGATVWNLIFKYWQFKLFKNTAGRRAYLFKLMWDFWMRRTQEVEKRVLVAGWPWSKGVGYTRAKGLKERISNFDDQIKAYLYRILIYQRTLPVY